MASSNLEIQQGIDSEIFWDITNEDGTPADLAGFSAQMEVRRSMDPTSELYYTFHPTCEGSSVILRIDSEETYLFTWVRGKSTLVILDPDDQPIDIVWSGQVVLKKIATRVET